MSRFEPGAGRAMQEFFPPKKRTDYFRGIVNVVPYYTTQDSKT